jgi:hypothetical protein
VLPIIACAYSIVLPRSNFRSEVLAIISCRSPQRKLFAVSNLTLPTRRTTVNYRVFSINDEASGIVRIGCRSGLFSNVPGPAMGRRQHPVYTGIGCECEHHRNPWYSWCKDPQLGRDWGT